MTTYTNIENKAPGKSIAIVIASVAALLCMFQSRIDAQSVSSGSDESDGALNLAANLGVIVFDPLDAARWGRVLDADGDGVFNFTTINVAVGTTLKFSADKVNRPIYFLASGAVTISGTLDLNGANGFTTTDAVVRRQVAVAGSGGFSGGAGGFRTDCSFPATAGDGPLGGATEGACNGSAYRYGNSGGFSGNRYLLPLVGGSGGAGGADAVLLNGGAGGGAILIASSVSIAIDGVINARGGSVASLNTCSGTGAGGAIRLVAPSVTGTGTLQVAGGSALSCGLPSNPGMVRLEGYSISNGLILSAGSTFVTRGTPVDQTTFRPTSQLRVTSIAGVAVPPNPSGSFVVPDVAMSSSTAVPVNIEATGIPPGTVVTLEVFPQTPDNAVTVKLPPVQTTLTGTLQQSTATVNFVFPYGFSRGTIRATWVQ